MLSCSVLFTLHIDIIIFLTTCNCVVYITLARWILFTTLVAICESDYVYFLSVDATGVCKHIFYLLFTRRPKVMLCVRKYVDKTQNKAV